MSPGLTVLSAVAVLLGNAFFVGAEFALVSARRSNIELEALNGSRLAKLTLSAMERVSLLLAGAQLGVTLCSLIFGALGEPLIARAIEAPLYGLGLSGMLIHPIAFVLALTLMVYVHVVIGEMVPKNLSLASSTRAALLLVPPLLFFVKATGPIVQVLNAIANGCVRLLGIKPRQEVRSSFSRDEVAGFVKESHREGLLSEEEEHLLSGTLDFEDRNIKQVILPIAKTIVASSQPTPAEIERLCVETGFSRFPVANTTGGFKGYVHLKDLLELDDSKRDQLLPPRLIRPLGTVKANSSLRQALATMQQTGSHIAQVKRGAKIIGTVMLEDVLEQLIGPIRDDTQKRKAQ